MRTLTVILFICLSLAARTQTLGGNAVFNFLKLPSGPMLTAAGGVNTSYQTNEVGLTANNPALLDDSVHSQLNLSFNSFLAGIKTYSLTGAYHSDKLNTSFGGHIYFVDYGSIPQTDAAGNISGSFRPVDFVVQVSAARSYLEKWNYGASLKFIQSSFQQFKSNAIAVDFGLHYTDSANHITASILAKNMGVQFKTYAGENEDLPFDLQIGITKRLPRSPFAFSLTAQHLQRFNINYNDQAFNNENELDHSDKFFTRLLNHFVLASHIYLGNNLEATLGFNHLRRSELNTGSSGNGLNGFSMGLRIKFQKLQILYARSSYQKNMSFNQLGLTVHLNQLFGMGKM